MRGLLRVLLKLLRILFILVWNTKNQLIRNLMEQIILLLQNQCIWKELSMVIKSFNAFYLSLVKTTRRLSINLSRIVYPFDSKNDLKFFVNNPSSVWSSSIELNWNKISLSFGQFIFKESWYMGVHQQYTC